MRHALLLLLAAVALPASAEDGEWLNAKATATPTAEDGGAPSFVVGRPFRLDVEAAHPKGGVALLPEKLDLPDSLAERSESRRHLRRVEPGEEIDRYELELIAFEAGDIDIPSLRLAFGSTVAATKVIPIVVVSGLAADEQQVASSTRPEALAALEQSAAQNPAPRQVPIPDYRPLIWGGVALGLLALGAALWAWRRRRALAPTPAKPAPPPRPAHELALERLAALSRVDRASDELQKAFWVELSEVLRGYVGGRYGFDSIELTVAELLEVLEGMKTPGLDQARLKNLLVVADLAKFAKLVTPDEDCQRSLESAVGIVEGSRPPSEPPPGAERAPAEAPRSAP